jgi:hypothetical protein
MGRQTVARIEGCEAFTHYWWSMIFSENRCTLFGIMLSRAAGWFGSAENLAENGGPDPHTRRCHPASNGRRALARFILQSPIWRKAENTILIGCPTIRFPRDAGALTS